jgi:hypothetical protein
VGAGQLFFHVMVEPLLRFVLLTLRAMTMATGVLDRVLSPTALALREAVTVMSAAAVLDGTDDLAVRSGELGIALQVCWGKRRADIAEGGHDRSLPSRVDALSGGEGR